MIPKEVRMAMASDPRILEAMRDLLVSAASRHAMGAIKSVQDRKAAESPFNMVQGMARGMSRADSEMRAGPTPESKETARALMEAIVDATLYKALKDISWEDFQKHMETAIPEWVALTIDTEVTHLRSKN